MYKSSLIRGPTLLLVLAVACVGERQEPSAPSALASAVPEVALEFRTLDEELIALAGLIPGFGGLFADPSGTVILLQDPVTQRDVAAEVVGPFLRQVWSLNRNAGDRPLVFRPARYLFTDLAAWRREFDSQMPEGTVWTDIDERRNQVLVAVATDEAATATEAILTKLGVPDSARSVVRATFPVPGLDSLRGVVRPTTAGVWILRYPNANCSLGANVWKAGSYFFITNSHCSEHFLDLDTSDHPWFQVGFDTVAVGEDTDPEPFTGGACPSGKACRYSDAALIEYDDESDWEGAHIAEATDEDPPYEFTDRLLIELDGSYSSVVIKVGYQTGLTYGTQGSTCVNQSLDSTSWAAKGITIPGNLVLLCQNIATSMEMDSGDSGGPIFSVPSGSCSPNLCSPAFLRGVVWGFDASYNVYYSPMAGIKTDLGNIKWDIY